MAGWLAGCLSQPVLYQNGGGHNNVGADVLLCCSDGQKMSKRKKNYPDPMEIVNKYGADAIRCVVFGQVSSIILTYIQHTDPTILCSHKEGEEEEFILQTCIQN